MKITALIFDMDGTLYESEALSEQYRQTAWRFVAEGLGVSPKEARRLLESRRAELAARTGLETTTTQVMEALGLNVTSWIAIRDAEIFPEKHLRPDPRITALFERLAKRYRLAVVTNNTTAVTQRTLSALGLGDRIGHVFTMEETGIPKPSPELYRYAAAAMGVQPHECVSIGDRPDVDLKPAAAAGMLTLQVADPADLLDIEARIEALEV